VSAAKLRAFWAESLATMVQNLTDDEIELLDEWDYTPVVRWKRPWTEPGEPLPTSDVVRRIRRAIALGCGKDFVRRSRK
jgi:hypothetical protein